MRLPCLTYLTNSSNVIDKLCGKTNCLNRKRVGVVFYYFDYKKEGQTVLDVVRCLLKQLVCHLVGLLSRDHADDESVKSNDEIEKCYENIKLAYYSWKNSGSPKLEDFLKLFIASTKPFSSVFIVLDAYDESLERERSGLIKELSIFSESGLRQLITTRPHILDDKVKKALNVAHVDIVEIQAQRDDVEKYLTMELDKNVDDVDPELRDTIVRKITSAVQGQYNLVCF
jgi:hypothetical protein